MEIRHETRRDVAGVRDCMSRRSGMLHTGELMKSLAGERESYSRGSVAPDANFRGICSYTGIGVFLTIDSL